MDNRKEPDGYIDARMLLLRRCGNCSKLVLKRERYHQPFRPTCGRYKTEEVSVDTEFGTCPRWETRRTET